MTGKIWFCPICDTENDNACWESYDYPPDGKCPQCGATVDSSGIEDPLAEDHARESENFDQWMNGPTAGDGNEPFGNEYQVTP